MKRNRGHSGGRLNARWRGRVGQINHAGARGTDAPPVKVSPADVLDIRGLHGASVMAVSGAQSMRGVGEQRVRASATRHPRRPEGRSAASLLSIIPAPRSPVCA